MNRTIWLALSIAAVALVLAGCGQNTAVLEQELTGIEAMEDAAGRSEAAVAFVIANASMPDEVMERAVDAAVSSAEEAGGGAAVIAVWETLFAADAPAESHYNAMAQLDKALIESDDPANVARAEELARELIADDNATNMPHVWVTWFHSNSALTDKELAVDAALAGHRRSPADEAGQWPVYLDIAYTALFDDIARESGFDGAVSAIRSRITEADDATVTGVLYANLYKMAVDENPEMAAGAARDFAAIEGFNAWLTMNNVAYDMADRGLEPELAVEIAERALGLAETADDSLLVLDTAGWAHLKAGNQRQAIDYLSQAAYSMKETPTLGLVQFRHLLDAYTVAGRDDEAIDLLALIVSRSVDEDDPSRAELEALLLQRDGSTSALDDVVTAKRYEGIEVAPAFSLPARSGGTVGLEDMRGDVLLVCFWGYG
jgi:tetratricopeptide (TPR) repeat protein